MRYPHLTHNIAYASQIECDGSCLIVVSDSLDAAVVLERVLDCDVHCWIGCCPTEADGECASQPYVYAAHPLQMWNGELEFEQCQLSSLS